MFKFDSIDRRFNVSYFLIIVRCTTINVTLIAVEKEEKARALSGGKGRQREWVREREREV